MKYLVLLLVMFNLAACYEDSDVTLHEAGVYKGGLDPHALTAEQRSEVLAKRFKQVQTDRE